VCTVGLLGWAVGRFVLHLPSRRLGVVICGVVIVNTGYLGLPMTIALLGQHALGSAVAYDQLVSAPSLFLLGFGVGAMFGDQAGTPARRRLRTFFTRNPPLWAVVAGALAPHSLAPAPLPAISHVVVAALLVIGFFTVGVHLSAGRDAYSGGLLDLPRSEVWLALGLRLLVSPLIVAAMSMTVVTVPSAYVLEAAMPSGITVLLVAHIYGLDERLAATIIVWSTAVVIIVGLLAQAL
jgi:malate permease and related proteins